MSGQIKVRVEEGTKGGVTAADMLSPLAQMAEQLWRLDSYIYTATDWPGPLWHHLDAESAVTAPVINLILGDEVERSDRAKLLECLADCRMAVLRQVPEIHSRDDVAALLRDLVGRIREYQVDSKQKLVATAQLDHDTLADILSKIRNIDQLNSSLIAFSISGQGGDAVIKESNKLVLVDIELGKPVTQHKYNGIFCLASVSLEKDVAWRGKLNGRTVKMEITDKAWLDKFMRREIALKHGDALLAEFTRYDDGRKSIYYLTNIIGHNTVVELEQLELDFNLKICSS